MRVIAVDWSGRARGASEFIWLAEVVDGILVRLENGRDRRELTAELVAVAAQSPDTVVGLDFAFSFPAWWCAAQGWRTGPDVWRAMATDGERLLSECRPPLWGRPGHRNPNPPEGRWRRTEVEDVPGAKSVFQIGGSGTVGTGSIRGMPHLLTLAVAGFDVWPFSTGGGGSEAARMMSLLPGGTPRALEVYPRLFTGPVNKSSAQARRLLLDERYAGAQDAALLTRAAGSEDAFDAAVSALEMDRHRDELRAPERDPAFALEGRVWRPQPRD